MSEWLATFDQRGELQSLRSPDGTAIEIYPDRNIILTPDGYRVQINIHPPGFLVLDRINNHNGKQVYKNLKRIWKEK